MWLFQSPMAKIFLHKIVPGAADRSYGIHVAQMAGLPARVISRANEILKQLEATSGTTCRSQRGKRAIAPLPRKQPLDGRLQKLDLEAMTPIQALNKLYEWKMPSSRRLIKNISLFRIPASQADR